MVISELINLLTRELLVSGDLTVTLEMPDRFDDRRDIGRVTKVLSLVGGDYYVIAAKGH